MELFWKILLNYFIKVGTLLGIFPYTFEGNFYKANKCKALRIYGICSNIIIFTSFPLASVFLFKFFRGDFDAGKFLLTQLVSISEFVSENICIYTIVWSLIFKYPAKVFEVVNCGSELSRIINAQFTKQFLIISCLLVIIMEWFNSIWMIQLNYNNIDVPISFCMILYAICDFIIMFVANLFIGAFCCAGLFYKTVNKELKLIIKPLKNKQQLTHNQMIEISELMDQKMILHAKIGKFVNDINKIFSLICVSIMLNSFVIIIGELYSFYAKSRIENEDTTAFSIQLGMFQISLMFCLVYAANEVSEQFEATGDVLKVFLDSSVDNRLKNSVKEKLF